MLRECSSLTHVSHFLQWYPGMSQVCASIFNSRPPGIFVVVETDWTLGALGVSPSCIRCSHGYVELTNARVDKAHTVGMMV